MLGVPHRVRQLQVRRGRRLDAAERFRDRREIAAR